MSALPGDPPFSQFNNHYDVASYKRLCNEFGINPSSDFRFMHGANLGLGSVYLYGDGAFKTDNAYPGWNKFSDEGGKAIKGNKIYFIEQAGYGDTQADWFATNTASGLTQAGLSRINQSIEAFVYCERSQQYSGLWRLSERSPKRVPGSDRRRDQTARRGQEREKVPARGG